MEECCLLKQGIVDTVLVKISGYCMSASVQGKAAGPSRQREMQVVLCIQWRVLIAGHSAAASA
jgi:hypothetical protein